MVDLPRPPDPVPTAAPVGTDTPMSEPPAPPPSEPPAPLASEPPAPPTRTRRPVVLALVLVGVLAAGVVVALTRSGGGRPGSDGLAVIEFPDASVTVTDVQVLDRYPKDCISGPGCLEPLSGRKLVVVFVVTEGDPPDAQGGEELHIVGSDGERVPSGAVGFEFDDEGGVGTEYYAFAPVISANDFRLVWPGADPVELGV